MTDPLPMTSLAGFVVASLVLAVTPGPGVLYIVTRCVTQGRRRGFASVAGVALGNLGNALAAACGLGALFAVSAGAFTAVKFAGAGYLAWLGLRALLRPAPAVGHAQPASLEPALRVFRDGALVALLNPKTTLFFAAYLPQFVPPGTEVLRSTAMLGAAFVVIAALTDSLYVLAAAHWAARLPHTAVARAGRLAGWVYLALAGATAAGGTVRR